MPLLRLTLFNGIISFKQFISLIKNLSIILSALFFQLFLYAKSNNLFLKSESSFMANAFSIAGHLASHQADRMIENQFQNAVDICSSVYFDLIFLSSSIGAEDYTKYIEAFRTIPIYENTIILLMLKQNDQELEVITGDCGVNDSVSIPADFNQITTNIKKYI